MKRWFFGGEQNTRNCFKSGVRWLIKLKTHGLPVPPLHSFTYVTSLYGGYVLEINQQIYIQPESIVGTVTLGEDRKTC